MFEGGRKASGAGRLGGVVGGVVGGPAGMNAIAEASLDAAELDAAESTRASRDCDVAGALNDYRIELLECVKMREAFPHNNEESEEEAEEEKEENEEEEEEEGEVVGEGGEEDGEEDALAAAMSPGGIRRAGERERAEEDAIMNMTPSQILDDLSSTYSDRGGAGPAKSKKFRACHALSMRRKISSYHRNGLPSALRGRSGRKQAFENSKFMKSRKMLSRQVGLHSTESVRGLEILGIDHEGEESSNDDDNTTADEAEHYHSYHLFEVFESLHQPRVEGRPGSARTIYLR